MKLHTVQDNPGMLTFQCPGCGNCHAVWTESPNARTGAKWGWNGSMDKPTFTPSILVTADYWEPAVTPENIEQFKREPWPQQRVKRVCHSYVTDGKIQYLNDCTHALAGQTVEIPEW